MLATEMSRFHLVIDALSKTEGSAAVGEGPPHANMFTDS